LNENADFIVATLTQDAGRRELIASSTAIEVVYLPTGWRYYAKDHVGAKFWWFAPDSGR
jgi:hypothetical protein